MTAADPKKQNSRSHGCVSKIATIARRLAMFFLLCVPALLLARPMQLADLAVLSDPGERETIASVSAPDAARRFVPLRGGLNAGYTRDVHWLRFTVPALPAGARWLEVQPPFLDDLRLYEPTARGFRERRAGDRLPFAARELPYRAFVFKLTVPEQSLRTYYLRVQTTSTSVAFLNLWQPDDFLAAAQFEYTLIGTGLGILGIVLCFNLILWLWLRDPLHGWFCLHLLFYTGINIGINGFASEFLFPDHPDIADAWVAVSLFAAISAGVPFYRRMLRIDASTPLLHATFRLILVAPLALIPASFMGYHTETARIAMGVMLLITWVALWRSWCMWREGRHEGLLLLIANALPMFGSMMTISTVLGLYAGDLLALNSRQITGIGAILAMHFALATRIKAMRADLHEAGILKTIMDFVPSGVTLFDSDLRMIACNERFKRLLDFPDEMFKDGLPDLRQLITYNANRGDYGAGDPAEQVRHAMERATAMEPHVFERTRPDGTVLEIRGTPLPGKRGFVTIYTDITERKRAEQEAKRYALYLDTVLNTLPQGVSVVDENLRMVLWNQRLIDMLGLPEHLLQRGAPFAEVIRYNAMQGEYGNVDPEQKVRQIVELAMRFEPHRLERTRPQGQTIEIEGRPMQIEGSIAGFVSTYTDITQRIRNEQELNQKNIALIQAIRAREDAERIARHDLKTPLASIAATPALLRAGRTVSQEEDAMLSLIENAANRALRMVNLSLDLYRMESGAYVFQPDQVNLSALALAVTEDLRVHAQSKRVSIRISGEQPHVFAQADASLCYSILANLLKNAVEAAPDHSEVGLAFRVDEQVHVHIHNDGAVPAALRDSFFEKYATLGKSGGMGLGTYSSRLMAQMQGGSLIMETSDQAGTTLTLTLARSSAPELVADPGAAATENCAPDGGSEPSAPSELFPLRVLVADDDSYNCQVLIKQLPARPLEVEVVINGRLALQAAMARRPDLVFMDIEMPVMGGIEAMRRIREFQKSSGQAPSLIVAFSSNDDADSQAKYLALGFDRCLSKPTTKDEVIATLNAVPVPGGQESAAGHVVWVESNLMDDVPAFLASRAELVNQMLQATAEDDRNQLRRLAHKLSGSLGMFGFEWAGDVCKEIERTSMTAELSWIAAKAEAVGRHLRTVKVCTSGQSRAEESESEG